ncbi:MAG TPA: hypothetical protein VGS96_19715 [Thermoanaerobaculia bacterium]|jgi:membrane associated rhomboid family serine protease|nr:hypothetical protein [Thermoanaerobaculia bacterium]
MLPNDVAVLTHLVGFLIGAALYAMLFALVVRKRVLSASRPPKG